MRRIDALLIHHTASASGDIASITREHIARGWTTIGYHYIIGNGKGTPDGKIEPGRPEWMVGASVFGANTGKLAISLVGNFHKPDPGYTGRPSGNQLKALERWLLDRGAHYQIGADHIKGHKEVTIPGHPTVCPGSEFPLGMIRSWYHLRLKKQTTFGLVPWLINAGYYPREK